MFSDFLKSLSILKKFLFINLIIFLVIGSLAFIYISNVKPNLIKNKTTLVIAHRLSTIHNADQIFVLKNGTIIDSGSHDYLIEKSNEYKSLYQKQLKQV